MTKINKLISCLLLALFLIPLAYAEWVDVSPDVKITQTRQALDRVNRVLFSYVNITNTSAKALAEPVRLVITNPSIPVLNANGTTDNGDAYLDIAGGLDAGASIKIRVDFELKRQRLSFGTSVESQQSTAPIANAGADQSVFVGDTVQLDGSASSDMEGEQLSYQWSFITQPQDSQAILIGADTLNPTVDIDLPGVYEIQLIVNDGNVDSLPDTVVLTTQNSKPVADAGQDQSVFVGEIIQLDGFNSHDADSDPLTYQWSLPTIPDGSQAVLNNPTLIDPVFTIDLPGSYQARLQVYDGIEYSDFDNVTINTQNSRPVANAGADQQALVGDTVNLDGRDSDDADNDNLSFEWSLIARPDNSEASIADPFQEQTHFIPDLTGIYVAQLLVRDSTLTSEPDTSKVTVDVIVNTNTSPVINSTAVTTATVGQNYSYAVNASDSDGHTLTYSLEVFPAGMSIDENTGLILWTPDTEGDFPVTVKVIDGFGGQIKQTYTITVAEQGDNSNLPPDPETLAPPLDQTAIPRMLDATRFLYTGTSPIQTGVTESTIDEKKVAVIRGRVLDKQNNPLSGVTIAIRNHPEFGQTLSRADGMFDMAVNGGEILGINFSRSGYLPVQRKLKVIREDYALPPDVVLLQLDQQANRLSVTPSSEMQVVRGTQMTDSDGVRQATLLVPKGTQAEMVMPDGQKIAFSRDLVVRATEYTVGANGPLAMPGDLPPTSAYTYAVELSVDEAMEKGAVRVEFDRPMPFYLENFLNFPVGLVVPTGYYDREKAAWIPSLNGRVIAILSESGNLAVLDVDGDGQADNQAALDTLGITSDELNQLASLYEPGQSLWRVPLTHFTPWDHNWPRIPTDGATASNQAEPNNDPTVEETPEPEESSCAKGSIIECQNQVLRQNINLVGTPLSLNYTSKRAAGRKTEGILSIPLSGNTLPPDLKRIELEINILGRRITRSYAPETNLSDTFTWDSLDVYSRLNRSTHFAKVRVGYVYDAEYAEPGDFEQSFATLSGVPITGSRAREEITLWKESRTPIGGWKSLDNQNEGVQSGIGGWSLDVHHLYDSKRKKILLGDGTEQTISRWISSAGILPLSGNVVDTVVGNGNGRCQDDPTCGDGDPATDADINPYDVVVSPDGSLYISDWLKRRVRRVDINGIISTVAGNGTSCTSSSNCGDGGLAIDAPIGQARGLALGDDGSLYITSNGPWRVRRILSDGSISTVAGTGERGFSGDGGSAIQAQIALVNSIAVASDGSFYIADTGNYRVRRVGTDGIITTVAGNGAARVAGDANNHDDGLATEASMTPVGVALDLEGNLYISDKSFVDGMRIRQLTPSGVISTIAGGNCNGFFNGDGIPAIDACINVDGKLTIAADGSLYYADNFQRRIRKISPDGIITTVAGTNDRGLSEDGQPALQALFSSPTQVALGSEGNLYVVDRGSNNRIRRIGPPGDRLQNLTLRVASENGNQVFEFDAKGRHLATQNALTGANLYTFAYNDKGYLVSVTDGDNNITSIQRASDGQPTAITGPYGQSTTLTLDSQGYLASVSSPAGETHSMSYTEDGLITQFTNPNQFSSTYTYGPLGRLIKARNAAGGGLDLSITEQGSSYQVVRESVMNRRTTYKVQDLPTGTQERSTTFPDGTQTTVSSGADGKYLITSPDGMKTERIETADPRFSIQAPIAKSRIISNGSLKRTLTHQREVELSDESDIFSLVKQTDTFSLNARNFTRFYDAPTKTFTNTSAENRQTTSVMDELGRVTEIAVPGITPSQVNYDVRGRLHRITQGDRELAFSYNPEGYLAGMTDPLGRSINFEYDLAGRVKKQILPGNREILYAYDAAGNMTSLTPPGKSAHTFDYTAINQQAVYTPPAIPGGGKTDYSYNLDRQLDLVTRPDGAQLDYAYDNAGRLDTLSIPRGTYDYQYNSKSQLEKILAPEGNTLAYRYNDALLTKVTSSGIIAGSVGFSYDNDFRLSEIKVNNSDPVAYSYDGDSLLTQAGDLSLSYRSENGLLAATTLENISDSYSYNAFAEMSTYNAVYNSSALYSVNYNRDKLGRITQKTETIAGATKNINYSYDVAGRLDTVSENNSQVRDYDYDSNGNRTHVNGVLLGQYDAQDRLQSYGSVSYSYTANGELKTKTEGLQVTQYHYDVLGNLISVNLPDGTLIEYVIDGQNRRIGKKLNGTLQQGFLYADQLNPIAELDANGNIVSRFVYASHSNVPDMIIKAGQSYRVVTDQLGSPRLVVNIATGEIAQQLDYDEFGNVLLDTDPGFQPFGFAGGIYDLKTEFVRFGVRDYDSKVGRWTSKDPILFDGEDTNLYAYVTNNPINLIDITGFKPCKKGGNQSGNSSPQKDNIDNAKRVTKFGFSVFGYFTSPPLVATANFGIGKVAPTITVPDRKIDFSPWNPLNHIDGLLNEGLFKLPEAAEVLNSEPNSENNNQDCDCP